MNTPQIQTKFLPQFILLLLERIKPIDNNNNNDSNDGIRNSNEDNNNKKNEGESSSYDSLFECLQFVLKLVGKMHEGALILSVKQTASSYTFSLPSSPLQSQIISPPLNQEEKEEIEDKGKEEIEEGKEGNQSEKGKVLESPIVSVIELPIVSVIEAIDQLLEDMNKKCEQVIEEEEGSRKERNGSGVESRRRRGEMSNVSDCFEVVCTMISTLHTHFHLPSNPSNPSNPSLLPPWFSLLSQASLVTFPPFP